MSQKQVMPKSEDLSRSLEINAIWTFDTEFPTIFNKSCTYITFKSAVKHRQLGYIYIYICVCVCVLCKPAVQPLFGNKILFIYVYVYNREDLNSLAIVVTMLS